MIPLFPGQMFVVHADGTVPDLINIAQFFINSDHNSKYTHAGIVLDSEGNTFESKKKIGFYNIKAYKGMPICITHHKLMTKELFDKGFDFVKKHNGATYPYLRLALHLVGLADNIHWKHPVCSELNKKFEVGCGLAYQWWGVNPDMLSDEWHRCVSSYEIDYEGFL